MAGLTEKKQRTATPRAAAFTDADDGNRIFRSTPSVHGDHSAAERLAPFDNTLEHPPLQLPIRLGCLRVVESHLTDVLRPLNEREQLLDGV
jgi:hypothetical protein